MDVKQRQQVYLDQSGAVEPPQPRRPPLLSRLAAGDTDTAQRWIDTLLTSCNAYEDCTDFDLNMLLRALMLFGDRMSAETKAAIRSTALRGRYYGGFSRDYPMFCNSENHHLNWAVAEYLVGQLWPDEVHPYDERTGAQHKGRGRFHIARWIDGRARWGFREWNSSVYMGVDLLSLLNLVDLAEDDDIRELARASFTQMLADLAADSAYGGVWSAQARIYEPQLFSASEQGLAGVNAMLLSYGDIQQVPATYFNDFVATTTYRAPDWLVGLATDLSKPMVNQERHREEKGVRYACHSAFWKPPEELWRDRFVQSWYPEDVFEFDIRTERRSEYIVSAAITSADFPLNHSFAQSMIWLSCLKGRVQVFTTQPRVDATDQRGRNVYWAGTTVMPRCYVQDGVLAAVYHSTAATKPNAADFTHAYFPTPDFDEWQQHGAWFVGRVDDAYVGLLAPQGAMLATEGEWAGRDLRAPGRTAAWVAVYGSEAQDGDFESFMERCRQVKASFDSSIASLAVSAGDVNFAISYENGVTVDGSSFSAQNWKQIENPVVQGDWGEPSLHIVAPGGGEVLDMSEAARIMEHEYAKL